MWTARPPKWIFHSKAIFMKGQKMLKEFERWRTPGTCPLRPLPETWPPSSRTSASCERIWFAARKRGRLPRLRLCFLCSQMQPLQPNIIRQSYTTVRRSLAVAERKRRCRTKAAKMGKPESVKRACTNKKRGKHTHDKVKDEFSRVVHVSNQMQLLNKNQEEMSHTT